MKNMRSFNYALFSTLALFTALQGCGDDKDENAKPPTVKPTGGSSGSGGEPTGNDGGTDNQGGTTSNPGTGGTGAEAGGPPEEVAGAGGGGGAPPGPACDPLLGANGCFNCPANGEQEEWLNRCVSSDCEPFANTKQRLPLLNTDGTLPNLPN